MTSLHKLMEEKKDRQCQYACPFYFVFSVTIILKHAYLALAHLVSNNEIVSEVSLSFPPALKGLDRFLPLRRPFQVQALLKNEPQIFTSQPFPVWRGPGLAGVTGQEGTVVKLECFFPVTVCVSPRRAPVCGRSYHEHCATVHPPAHASAQRTRHRLSRNDGQATAASRSGAALCRCRPASAAAAAWLRTRCAPHRLPNPARGDQSPFLQGLRCLRM